MANGHRRRSSRTSFGWRQRQKVSEIPAMGMTEAEIDAGRSLNGGFTRMQLAEWGVEWPPRKGWKRRLMRGEDPNR